MVRKHIFFFYNQQEESDSQVVYNATISTKQKFQFNKTYKSDKRFGYLLIKNIDKNLNEVTVGIGGVKITTEAKTTSMKSDAKMMMEIVNSVRKIEKEGKDERK